MKYSPRGKMPLHLVEDGLGVLERRRLVVGVRQVAARSCARVASSSSRRRAKLLRPDLVGHAEGEHRDRGGVEPAAVEDQPGRPRRPRPRAPAAVTACEHRVVTAMTARRSATCGDPARSRRQLVEEDVELAGGALEEPGEPLRPAAASSEVLNDSSGRRARSTAGSRSPDERHAEPRGEQRVEARDARAERVEVVRDEARAVGAASPCSPDRPWHRASYARLGALVDQDAVLAAPVHRPSRSARRRKPSSTNSARRSSLLSSVMWRGSTVELRREVEQVGGLGMKARGDVDEARGRTTERGRRSDGPAARSGAP